MIAPRDSWMMPPLYNEMIPSEAPARVGLRRFLLLADGPRSSRFFFVGPRAPVQALSSEFDAMGVVNEAVEDSVGVSGVAEYRRAATILDRVVSRVTITDPRHFLFGHRLRSSMSVLGAATSYVVVELADGRKRSVRIAATDLVPPGNSSSAARPSLPRISVRTLIPLARHLNLLTEEVIRDEPAGPSASSRCVSTIDPGRQDQPVFGSPSVSVAEPVARDSEAQIARILAELLRRMLPADVAPAREMARADRRARR